jgi:hypothetical protein
VTVCGSAGAGNGFVTIRGTQPEGGESLAGEVRMVCGKTTAEPDAAMPDSGVAVLRLCRYRLRHCRRNPGVSQPVDKNAEGGLPENKTGTEVK